MNFWCKGCDICSVVYDVNDKALLKRVGVLICFDKCRRLFHPGENETQGGDTNLRATPYMCLIFIILLIISDTWKTLKFLKHKQTRGGQEGRQITWCLNNTRLKIIKKTKRSVLQIINKSLAAGSPDGYLDVWKHSALDKKIWMYQFTMVVITSLLSYSEHAQATCVHLHKCWSVNKSSISWAKRYKRSGAKSFPHNIFNFNVMFFFKFLLTLVEWTLKLVVDIQ